MSREPVGFQSVVFEENGDDKYKFNIQLTGANLQRFSLLLASLHLIEKELVYAIDTIEVDYELRE